MLISLLLTLTPESPATLPPELGRAVQAETLARLGQVDPAPAAALHAGVGRGAPRQRWAEAIHLFGPGGGRGRDRTTPTRAELEDPAVIVGDIGLPGGEAIGHSPALNNFDHHYSHAGRSATHLFNQTYAALRSDIVTYIDAVDLVGGQEAAAATLKAATVGVRVRHAGDDLAILAEGGRLLRWLEETDTPPGDISNPIPNMACEHITGLAQQLAWLPTDGSDPTGVPAPQIGQEQDRMLSF